jgi:sugar phosphate isomerase/epimerase
MLQSGIFTGYFPYTLEETVQKIKGHGFNTVQLDVEFKDMRGDEAFSSANVRKIRDTFRSHNLPICCISGYTNIVHPDKVERSRRLEHLKNIIRHARDLGSAYVISETGTFHADSDWVHDDKNKTQEGYDECLEIIGELTTLARAHDVTFCVETYVNNVIGSVEETLKLFTDINDVHLGLLMDPTNYFESHNIEQMDQVLNHIFDALNDKIKIAHAKDVKLADSQQGVKMSDIDADEAHSLRGVGAIDLPAPGLGSLNYDLYLKRLAQHHSNIPVIIEHLEEEDVPRAKQFLDGKFLELGL